MKEKVLKKKIAQTLGSVKNENTLESYLVKNVSGDMWWKQEGELKIPENERKKEFLEKDTKATEVMPSSMKKDGDVPDNLGYFESKFGTVSVGYKKFKENSGVAFSLIPEKVKIQEGIPERKQNSPNTYFGGEMKGRKKFFKVSNLSFKYDPNTEEVKKMVSDNDGIPDTQGNLLYEDEKELEKIEDLQEFKRSVTPKVRGEISSQMNTLRQIRSEEQEDNAELLRQIKDFVKKMKKDTLRKIISSDESVSRKNRIAGAYDDVLMLRALAKRLIEELRERGIETKGFDAEKLSKKELKDLVENLKKKLG